MRHHRSMTSFVLGILIWTVMTSGMSSCLRTRDQIREQSSFQVGSSSGDRGLSQSVSPGGGASEEYAEQIRLLTGRVEELESQMRTLSKRVESGVGQDKIAELERRMSLMVEELKNQKAELENLRVSWQEEQAQAQKKREAEAKDPWQQAEESFAAQDWRKAILSYQKFRDQNSKSPKFIEATYKMAVCFEKLNMKTEAVAFYEEVVEKAPKSEEAKKAKLRLKKLK